MKKKYKTLQVFISEDDINLMKIIAIKKNEKIGKILGSAVEEYIEKNKNILKNIF